MTTPVVESRRRSRKVGSLASSAEFPGLPLIAHDVEGCLDEGNMCTPARSIGGERIARPAVARAGDGVCGEAIFVAEQLARFISDLDVDGASTVRNWKSMPRASMVVLGTAGNVRKRIRPDGHRSS
jgi:hypothetical protein